ncbi:MAG TPA: hypothetical protein VH500_14470 [Nitrososphaeraceae archaeon]|jgi:hypothetical protein
MNPLGCKVRAIPNTDIPYLDHSKTIYSDCYNNKTHMVSGGYTTVVYPPKLQVIRN